MLLPVDQRRPQVLPVDLAQTIAAADGVVSPGLWLGDPAGGLLYLSPDIQQTFGITLAECRQVGLLSRMPDEELEPVIGHLRRCLATGEPWQAWFHLRDAAGHLRPARGRGKPVRDGAGRIIRWVGAVEPGPEHTGVQTRLVRQALQQSEERFRMLVDALADHAVCMLDPDGHIATWHAGAERITGYAAHEIVGRPMSVLHPWPLDPHDMSPVAELELAARTGRFEGESWRVRRDGSRFRSHVVITPMRDDGGVLVGFAKVMRDVTERLEAQAVRESRDELGIILRGVADGIIAQTAEGSIVFANDAAAHAIGHPSAQFMVDHGLAPLPDGVEIRDDHGRLVPFDQLPAQRALRGEKLDEMVLSYRGPSLRERWLIVQSTPVFDEHDRVRMAITILRDITRLKQTQEQLRQSQKMEAIGRLAGGIAHDFNNMLTAINGYSELIVHEMRPEDPLRHYVHEVRRSGERAAALTRQLLAYSRKQVLAPRTFNLNSVVAELDKMLRRLIGEHVALHCRLEPHLGLVHADVGQIEQVIVNLAVNARDAMEHGGHLYLETANQLISEADAESAAGVAPGAYVVLTVRDTGKGMDEDTRSKIFEPFFTTKEFGKGTGLGLSTVEGIVEQSGGAILVDSAVGEGTTFRLLFPQIQAASWPVEHTPAPLVARLTDGHEVVLLVEDERAVRTLLKRLLELNGYTVLDAGDGEEALQLAGQLRSPVSLLVTDVVMPHMNGNELAQHLVTRWPGLKVLFISGYTDDVVVRRGLPEEQTAFVQKPFTAPQIVRQIREMLDGPGEPVAPAAVRRG